MTRQKWVDDKFISARRHPTEPLTIYNYTARAQIAQEWNEHTRECRGLIVHDDGTVVARPYRKFFNLDEPHAEVPQMFQVYDKLDGSLGITYREPSTGMVAIASRGAFESEQAKHATALWRERYADVVVPDGQTWLFEIIYPANRIVLSYDGLDDLVLHGAINTATGEDLPLPMEWPGHRVERFEALPIADLIAMRPHAEGFVLAEWPIPSGRPRKRVKVKIPEYVRIHKLIGGCTPRRIWETLSREGEGALRAFLEGMPDEFYKEAMAHAERFRRDVDDACAVARATFDAIRADVGDGDRKAFALRIQQEPESDRAMLYAQISGKPIEPIAWKRVEPSAADEVAV